MGVKNGLGAPGFPALFVARPLEPSTPDGCKREPGAIDTQIADNKIRGFGTWKTTEETNERIELTPPLRRNLIRACCWCEEVPGVGGSNRKQVQAHHIVPETLGEDGTRQDAATLRECLKDRGIDIDSAWNGICLPADRDLAERSGTPLHSGPTNRFHGLEVLRPLLTKCQDKNFTTPEYKKHLEQAAKNYIRGLDVLGNPLPE